MSGAAARGGWMVATSIAAVEALKDQLGVCRWNYALRLMQKHAKNRVESYYDRSRQIFHPKSSSYSSSAGISGTKVMREAEKINRREKSAKKVMDLNCWGPTTVRF